MSTANPWVLVGKVTFGKGLFAKQDIPKGTDLGKVSGKVIDDPEYTSNYCIDLGDSLSLEPRTPFRYLNHRCEPNCSLYLLDAAYEDGSPAPSEVHVEALMDIPEGAELTIDYQWSADGAIKCLCGSNECRGWVVAIEELPQLLKSRARAAKKASKPKTSKAPKPR
ncbi:MAG TPA: SET domain-containing protein-lysine N-methyltransferase [Schlesneria sp.]|jgi:SET domain-containing protein